MKIKLLSLVIVQLVLAAGSTGQSCAIWNGIRAYGDGVDDNYKNYAHHQPGGYHTMVGSHSGSCTYQNQQGGTIGSTCVNTIVVADNPSGVEVGPTTDLPGYVHVGHFATKGGSNTAIGSASASAEAAVGVEVCFLGVCGFTVSIGPGGTIGVSSGNPIWTNLDTAANLSCPSEIEGCPIIIDTAGEGFQLTDAADGVVTDMVIPGRRIRFGWTKPGSHNAFLWLDGHLFGNYTEQPPSDDPNGFAALAVYDSNGDGVIDAKDPVFSQLRLWIDANHDGVAQPQELFTLPSLGVYSISLQHEVDKYIDANGNLFHYRGHLQKTSDTDRTIYDVYLASDIRKPRVAINNTLH